MRKRVETWNIVLSVAFSAFSPESVGENWKNCFVYHPENRVKQNKSRPRRKTNLFVLDLKLDLIRHPRRMFIWTDFIKMTIMLFKRHENGKHSSGSQLYKSIWSKTLAQCFWIQQNRFLYFPSNELRILRNWFLKLFSMSLKKYSTKNLWCFSMTQSFSAVRRVSWFLSIRNFARLVRTRFRVRAFASAPTICSTPECLQIRKRIRAVVARTVSCLWSGPFEQIARTEWWRQMLTIILSRARFASFWMKRFWSAVLHRRMSTISSNSGRLVLFAAMKNSPAVWHPVRHKLDRGDRKKSMSFRLMMGTYRWPNSLSQLTLEQNLRKSRKPSTFVSLRIIKKTFI